MNWNKFVKKERSLWHHHFYPSLFAGIIVGIISYLFELTVSNVILFASVGASAVILMNSQSEHLLKLNTAVAAYVLAIIISLGVYFFNLYVPLHVSINISLLVFLVGLSLFLFNSFHPPAITGSISFILLERPVMDLLFLFLAIIILLIFIRFFTYIFAQNLRVKDFIKEFIRSKRK